MLLVVERGGVKQSGLFCFLAEAALRSISLVFRVCLYSLTSPSSLEVKVHKIT